MVTRDTMAAEEVASRVAAELADGRQRGYPEGQLTKVTSLLHAFRSGGASTDMGRVESALANAGVRITTGASELVSQCCGEASSA